MTANMHKSLSRNAHLNLQPLDDRIVPATINLNDFPFANDGITDVVRVKASGDTISVWVDGRGRIRNGSGAGGTTIVGSSDSESFRVAANLPVGAIVNGSGGDNELRIEAPASFADSPQPIGVYVQSEEVHYGYGSGSAKLFRFVEIDSLIVGTSDRVDTVLVDQASDKVPDRLTIATYGDNDQVTIEDVRSPQARVLAGSGSDSFVASQIGLLQGPLQFEGGSGAYTLTINDSGRLARTVYKVDEGKVWRSSILGASDEFLYKSIANLTLNAGRADDVIQIYKTSAKTTVDAGAGFDDVSVGRAPGVNSFDGTVATELRDVAPSFRVLSLNGGADGGNLTLHDRANPYRYPSNDGNYTIGNSEVTRGDLKSSVRIRHSAFRNITLNAGQKDDLIRITAGGPHVTVNAGDGNDIVVGSESSNVINGEAGRDLLIGGYGFDTIAGGTSDDILVAGTTSHDASNSKLREIRKTWVRLDKTESQRRELLAPLLNSVTVQLGQPLDSLDGGTGDDWLWEGPPII